MEPGVVPVHLWRPELVPIEVGGAPTPDAVCCYAVVGRI
ncbi:hypothetical protein [Nocardia sp. IFM 10818]